MSRFTYEVVAHNGAGVYSRDHRRLADAKARAAEIAEKLTQFGNGPFEIQRVEWLDGGTRRYWMRRRSRWVPWDPERDIEDRQPDWRWPS